MKIRLQRVHYMPQDLDLGVLYYAEEFDAAAHLCACGCGEKIRTPIGPTEWSIEETDDGPTLRPSVGNWQRPCRSHYLITRGSIERSNMWTPEQIEAGRRHEHQRREAYYAELYRQRGGLFKRLWVWLLGLFQ